MCIRDRRKAEIEKNKPDELEGCTFKPKINAKKVLSPKKNLEIKDFDTFLGRYKAQDKIQKAKTEKNGSKTFDFKPSINKQSAKMSKKVTGQSPESVYERLISIGEKQKEKQAELQEQYKPTFVPALSKKTKKMVESQQVPKLSERGQSFKSLYTSAKDFRMLTPSASKHKKMKQHFMFDDQRKVDFREDSQQLTKNSFKDIIDNLYDKADMVPSRDEEEDDAHQENGNDEADDEQLVDDVEQDDGEDAENNSLYNEEDSLEKANKDSKASQNLGDILAKINQNSDLKKFIQNFSEEDNAQENEVTSTKNSKEQEDNTTVEVVEESELKNDEKKVAKNSAKKIKGNSLNQSKDCLLYTSPSPRDRQKSRMPSSA
eukprot:TRINITY_DN4887_c0_g1_i3.p1 TRINITY_DN4887_c0_g1~~TRINITY_DN4887_c0_g1_i3.p1  ORF type:complete len:374 (+),score=86.25 TRINITY_DN4887_c0_g1_i3:64-1185(+)